MGYMVHDDYLGDVELMSKREKEANKRFFENRKKNYACYFKQECHIFIYDLLNYEIRAKFSTDTGSDADTIAINFAKYIFCGKKQVSKGMDYCTELVLELATRGRFKGNDLEKIFKYLKKYNEDFTLFSKSRVRHAIKLVYNDYKSKK